jgi:hypothetical protein
MREGHELAPTYLVVSQVDRGAEENICTARKVESKWG